ncbi:beta-L-arabinofuranosidase domain-containing protein [Microbacterium sp. B2969]|uniref:Beta-L-arabinofuranosidase domain-containing protein n=1 Tax=Microbacterium alkaliflavum TaxID=3248839 RepID=A0ABW7Q2Z0_9MICO
MTHSTGALTAPAASRRHPLRSVRRAVALGTAAIVAAAGLAFVAPTAATAADISIESKKVLDLKLDGNLTDASTHAAAVSLQKGAAAYGTGVSGQAFNFNGSTALKLGTAAYLQPQDLTVSFWYKPNATMTGEQVFAWSKTVYNSDGWYLTSESDTSSLALSVGPSTGQPYKVAVDSPRATFFPAGQWTHIVVTYDKTTKVVTFYRNGVRQVATVKYPVSATATGVLGSESTSVKTLGYNGPNYNGSHLNGLLDEYSLYNGVATIADVVTLTQRGNASFDPATVAQSDANALSVPASADADFTLPVQGNSGSVITWASSNSGVLSTSGGDIHVTRPTGTTAASATLTASVSYGGSAPVTKNFTVTVPPVGATTPSIYLEEAGLENVLVEDDYLENANAKTVAYLLSLDPEKFLYSWYLQAGLQPTTTSGYGGWEATSGTRFQGHFFGHYISALSQAYSTTTDAATKAQLLAKLTAAVDGIKKAQDAYAAANPANAGFVAPFSISVLPNGGGGLLVPFYNLHKVLAGLLDAYEYAPAPVATKARAVAAAFGTWVKNWAGSLSNPASILTTEYGGMNEALYELYSITKDPNHKRAAEYFDETTLFQQLANGQDVLDGKHANTTIPKLVGALKRYTVFMDNPDLYATLTSAEKAALPMYRTAAEKFWEIVIRDHTYAGGGNSQSEHFHAADNIYADATNGTTSGYGENSTVEGCNEYNMLKLSRLLFQVTKDVKFADYYESTYINTILASQNPETGMVTYFQPQTAGYAKIFGTPLDQFWCDHGTGIESFTKLGDSIYFQDDTSVYVNMFRSSVYSSPDQNLKLTQTADIPNTDTATFDVASLDGRALPAGTTVRLRVPSWVAATPTLTVNGVVKDVAPLTDAGYISVVVAAGDKLTYKLPAKVWVDAGSENPNWVALKYGPVLLASELSRVNANASYTAGVLVQMSTADKSLNGNVTVADAAQWKADIATNLERISNGANNNGMTTMRFKLHNVDSKSAGLTFEPYYSLYNARYALYLTLVQPDSPESQAQILKEKQQQRIAETTIDSLTSFDDNNSEAGKNYKFNKSGVGVWLGQPYRDGQMATDAYFQYEMIVDPSRPANYLGVRYFGGDNGRTFDVYVNDVLLKHERITNAAGSSTWYVQYDEIPASVISGIAAKDSYKRDSTGSYVLDAKGQKIPVVTVRFQGNGTSYVGGVYGVYTASKTTYATDADLSALSFDGGRLTPSLAKGVYAYTVTVPQDATTATFDADPAVPSGLVYVGDILIDDTKPRTVALQAGDQPTVLTLRATAQDHTTSATYTVQIVREKPAPPLTVTAQTLVRCAAGKAVVTVQATNTSDVPVALAITTPYGSKQVAELAPGKTTSQAFTTKLATLPAGEASVKATATVDAKAASATVTAPIAALSCG